MSDCHCFPPTFYAFSESSLTHHHSTKVRAIILGYFDCLGDGKLPIVEHSQKVRLIPAASLSSLNGSLYVVTLAEWKSGFFRFSRPTRRFSSARTRQIQPIRRCFSFACSSRSPLLNWKEIFQWRIKEMSTEMNRVGFEFPFSHFGQVTRVSD